MTPDERIARIAERQYGVFTRRQAIDAGLSRHAIASRITSGRWELVHRTVYRVRGGGLTFHGRALAATLFCGEGSMCSFGTAARLWRVDGFGASETVHVTTTDRRTVRTRSIRVHRPRFIPDEDRVVHERISVTSVERTVLDLAAALRPGQLEALVDECVRRRLVSVDRLLTRLDGSLVRGAERLRRLLDARIETDSALEARFVRRLRDSGMPMPVPQFNVVTYDGRFVARVDFAYPLQRIAIEIDGLAYHSGRERFEADRARQNDLVAEGFTVLRFTAGDVDRYWPRTLTTLSRQLGCAGPV